jgi:hypothetical protein
MPTATEQGTMTAAWLLVVILSTSQELAMPNRIGSGGVVLLANFLDRMPGRNLLETIQTLIPLFSLGDITVPPVRSIPMSLDHRV